MCADKSDKPDTVSEAAKNIWLAGPGAYGRAFDVASEKCTAASKDVDKRFKDLVEKGIGLEKQTREQFARPLKTPKVAIEERIEKMRTYLGVRDTAAEAEIEKLKGKVKALEKELSVLNQQLKQGKA